MYDLFTPVLVISDPQIIQKILSEDSKNFIDQSNTYATGDDKLIFVEMLKSYHSKKSKKQKDTGNEIKKELNHSKLNDDEINKTVPLINNEINHLIQQFDKNITKNPMLKMTTLSRNYYQECISSFVFGVEKITSAFITKSIKLHKMKLIKIIKYLVFSKLPKLTKLLKVKFVTKEVRFFR